MKFFIQEMKNPNPFTRLEILEYMFYRDWIKKIVCFIKGHDWTGLCKYTTQGNLDWYQDCCRCRKVLIKGISKPFYVTWKVYTRRTIGLIKLF